MAGVPALGAGLGDLKSNSGVCERSVGAARSIDPVFFPGTGEMTQENQSPEIPARFNSASPQQGRVRPRLEGLGVMPMAPLSPHSS